VGNSGGALDLDWLSLPGATTVSTTAEVNRERVPGNFGTGAEKLFCWAVLAAVFACCSRGDFALFQVKPLK
jgi:hypothetical protein